MQALQLRPILAYDKTSESPQSLPAEDQAVNRTIRHQAAWVWLLLGILGSSGFAQAQKPEAEVPHWIWYPGERSPGAVTRHFRSEFTLDHPATVSIDATADNAFVLYVDGRQIGQGDTWQVVPHFEVKLSAGPHSLAASASNEAPGAAAFLLQASEKQKGKKPGKTLALSGPTWKTLKEKPSDNAWTKPGFDDSQWPNAADLGPLGTGPWTRLQFASGDASDRFHVPDGFSVESLAPANVTGSAVSFTFDPNGVPCVGIEGGPIVRLQDEDGDGIYDGRSVITPQMNNCQGMYFDIDPDGSVTLWAVGNGPKGTGIYRLADSDNDGAFETILHHVPTGGMGEHGPHAISRGPDGQLYFDTGNHAHLGIAVDPRSPVNEPFRYEGELLPHYNDARGHARGVMAPGGEILRSDDDGKTWSRVASGFRNQYDFAFNRMGEIFSFDSDMEWDIGLPWYRPVRVCFVPPGAEFGWRNGSGKWPTYYYDSLPAIIDVGRGSPTGVTFYEGHAFPKDYEDAFLYCDWSQGRILAARLTRDGAAYTGEQTDLVTGQPLNCTDIEVGPDGAVYFTTGGRGTPGGLFRVSWNEAKTPSNPPSDSAVDQAIDIPSPKMAYSRLQVVHLKQEAGEDWPLGLEEIARDADQPAERRRRALELMTQLGPQPTDELLIDLSKDHESELRARSALLMGMRSTPLILNAIATLLDDADPLVRRRACEALVRTDAEIPVERLLPLLGRRDRWVRYAARVAVEHGDPALYRDQLLGLEEPRALLEAMLALVRASKLDAEAQDDLFQRELSLWKLDLAPAERLDLLRLIGLTYLLGPQKPAQSALAAEFRARLLSRFRDEVEFTQHHGPDAERVPLQRELARLLAYLDEPRAIPLMLDAQALAKDDHQTQIHYAYCLRAMPNGWDSLSKKRLWTWYESASHWDGGVSFLGYLDFMVQELVARLTPDERQNYLKEATKYPFPSRVLVRSLDLNAPAQVEAVLGLMRSLQPGQSKNARLEGELLGETVEALAKSSSPAGREAIRALVESDPARIDLVTRSLSAHPTAADVPVFLSALKSSKDTNTLNAAFTGLANLETIPRDAETLRLVLRASRQAGPPSLRRLNALASKITGVKPPKPRTSFDDSLIYWERQYAQTFPNAPALTAPEVAEHHYTLPQLVSDVVRSGLVSKGSPDRGRRVLDRAKCLNCHKMGDQGAGLGPDLTTLSSRFRPEEVLESLIDPSKVISDQYKPVTIATSTGQIYNGMPAGGDDNTLILLLSDGSKVNIPKADIDEQAESKISVMPAGLIDTLSLQEIADMLALFEAQPKVEAPKDGR